MKRLIDLVADETLKLSQTIDKQGFVSLSNAFNKDVGIKYGIYMKPEDIETTLRKGLVFDKVVEEKGYDACYGFKTHYAIEREKQKKEFEITKKALDKACKFIDDLTGDCPIEHDELMFEKNCTEECTNCDNAISCWKEYLLKESEREYEDLQSK